MTIERSVIWTTAQFVAVILIELIGLSVIARILTPTDFGIYAAAFALFQLGRFLGQFGLHAVIMRATTIDVAMRREVVAIIVVTSSVVVCAFYLGVLTATSLFPSPDSARLLFWMAPLIPLTTFAMSGHAVLQRNLRFQTLFFARVGITLVYSAVAITLATMGWGADSLLFALLASALVSVVTMSYLSGWTFVILPSFRRFGSSTKFASVVFATTASDQLALAAVPLLIGRLLDAATLGVFSRANDIVQQSRRIVQETILPVILPHAFHVVREGRDLRPMFLDTLAYTTLLAWPAAGLMFAVANPLIAILLGPQWGDVPLVLQILAVGLVVFPLVATARVFILAVEREVILFVQTLIASLAIIAVVALTARFGLAAVATGIVVVQAIQMLAVMSIAMREMAVPLKDFARALSPSAAILIAVTAPTYWIGRIESAVISENLIALGTAIAMAAVLWLASIFIFRHRAAPRIVALGTETMSLLIPKRTPKT